MITGETVMTWSVYFHSDCCRRAQSVDVAAFSAEICISFPSAVSTFSTKTWPPSSWEQQVVEEKAGGWCWSGLKARGLQESAAMCSLLGWWFELYFCFTHWFVSPSLSFSHQELLGYTEESCPCRVLHEEHNPRTSHSVWSVSSCDFTENWT